MASPTAVNIGIGFDIKEVMQNTGLARNEIARFTRDVKNSLTDAEKFARDANVANVLFQKGQIDDSTHQKMIAMYQNRYGGTSDEAARANNLARVRSLLDATTTAQERYAQTLRFVQNMERWGNITREEAIRIINAQRNAILQLTQAEESARRSQTFVGQFIAGLGITTGPMLAAQAILQVVGAIKSFVRESVVLAAEYQRTEAAMKALTGSTAEAAKKMIEFRELDKKTPLSFLDFAKGAKTLMGFGLEAERTGAIMTSLSAISMGNAERFQSLALAFGQVRASGKLAGQEVLQMVNAGFNPLQEIAKLTGESMAELRQKTTDGQISFEEVALAIELATEAGGRFATMNEELQLTLAGQYDKYLSDMKMVQVEIGENLMPLMVQLLAVTRDLLAANDQSANSYNYLRTAAGSLALMVATAREYAHIQLTLEKSAVNLFINPLKALEDLRNIRKFSPTKDVLNQIEEARKEREFEAEVARKKKEEDEAKEQERAKKRLELGEEGYRQWRLNEARKETQTRNAEKQAQEKAKNELDAIEKTRQEFERLGKTKRELYMESIGFNAPGISVAEQAKRQESLKEFDAIEAHKKEEEAIKKKVRALVEEKNEVELVELAKRRKITQDELADAKEAIAEKRKEEARKREEKNQQDQIQRLVKENDLLGLRNLLAQKKIDQSKFDEAKQKIEDNVKSIQERFNPAIKYKNDLQEIKNLLAAGLIDQQTADKAGAALAKSVMGNIQQYQSPTRVGSMGDAMLAAQRASMTDKHQKMVEKYLKEIADKIAKNPGLIANFNP
jgi:tape measure domain-containing protein